MRAGQFIHDPTGLQLFLAGPPWLFVVFEPRPKGAALTCRACGLEADASCTAAELRSAGWRSSVMVRGWLCQLCARATRDIRGDHAED
jgi:hypothetical protein